MIRPQNAPEFIGPAGVHSAGRGRPSSSMPFCYRNIRLRSFGPSAAARRFRATRSGPVAFGLPAAQPALSPTASPQSILRYELGACPPSGEPVTPHFPASPHMPPNTASRGASAPAGTRLTCSPTAAGSCRALTRAKLRRRQRDRSRPLWEMWFLPGLPGGRVGLYLKVHHVIADGRGRGRDARGTARYRAGGCSVIRTAVDTGVGAVDPGPVRGQPAHVGSRARGVLLTGDYRTPRTDRVAGSARGLGRGPGAADQPQPADRPDRRLTLVRSRLEVVDAPRGKGAGSASFRVLRARLACAGCARPGRDGSPLGTG